MKNFIFSLIVTSVFFGFTVSYAKKKNGCEFDAQGNPKLASQTMIVFDSSSKYAEEDSVAEKKIASIMNQLQIFIKRKKDSGHILSFWHFGKKTGFEKNEPTNFLCLVGKPSYFSRPPAIELKNMKIKELANAEKFIKDMYYDQEEKGTTPLIDSLVTILDSPWIDLTTNSEKRELILISDLLENGDNYSFYEKEFWKKNPPKELAKQVLNTSPLDLKRMHVSVYFIKHKNIDVQGAELEQFWTELFLGWNVDPSISFRQIR